MRQFFFASWILNQFDKRVSIQINDSIELNVRNHSISIWFNKTPTVLYREIDVEEQITQKKEGFILHNTLSVGCEEMRERIAYVFPHLDISYEDEQFQWILSKESEEYHKMECGNSTSMYICVLNFTVFNDYVKIQSDLYLQTLFISKFFKTCITMESQVDVLNTNVLQDAIKALGMEVSDCFECIKMKPKPNIEYILNLKTRVCEVNVKFDERSISFDHELKQTSFHYLINAKIMSNFVQITDELTQKSTSFQYSEKNLEIGPYSFQQNPENFEIKKNLCFIQIKLNALFFAFCFYQNEIP